MDPHPSNYMIRDVWDFWSEQDSRFIKAMVGVSHHKRLKIMSVWWSRYFWEYLFVPGDFLHDERTTAGALHRRFHYSTTHRQAHCYSRCIRSGISMSNHSW